MIDQIGLLLRKDTFSGVFDDYREYAGCSKSAFLKYLRRPAGRRTGTSRCLLHVHLRKGYSKTVLELSASTHTNL